MQGRCIVTAPDDTRISPEISIATAEGVFEFSLNLVFVYPGICDGENAMESFAGDIDCVLYQPQFPFGFALPQIREDSKSKLHSQPWRACFSHLSEFVLLTVFARIAGSRPREEVKVRLLCLDCLNQVLKIFLPLRC